MRKRIFVLLTLLMMVVFLTIPSAVPNRVVIAPSNSAVAMSSINTMDASFAIPMTDVTITISPGGQAQAISMYTIECCALGNPACCAMLIFEIIHGW